ncbi:MAG TPA: YceI family protein [Usitatibacter sp.]|jgi:polyisoprenoid-binding protein YceI|nr:YceI family protein [Usitatibacter sp.]
MKRIALVALALAACPAFAEPETYTVDPAHTFPTYEIGHLGYSVQRGRFGKVAGKITLDEAAAKCNVDLAIEAASVSSGVEKLDEHLRSPDFFDAARYPQIGFKSSDCTMHQGRVASARGELTIRGVSRPVTLKANVFKCAPHPMLQKKACGGDFETSIRRSEFDMKYGLPDLGDQVKLRIGIEAVKD